MAVKVVAKDGKPAAGVWVDFSATDTTASAKLTASKVRTNSKGEAFVRARANDVSGQYKVIAKVAEVTATFSLTNLPASNTSPQATPQQEVIYNTSPRQIIKTDGDCQNVEINKSFSQLSVTVRAFGTTPQKDVQVTFAAPLDGPSATFSPSATVATDAQGVAAVAVTANDKPGPYRVTAQVTGSKTNPVSFSLTNLAVTASALPIVVIKGNCQSQTTGIDFRIPLTVSVTNFGKPVSNASVTFVSKSDSGAGATFNSQPSSTVLTDAQGEATVTATANATAGAYIVTAYVTDLETANVNFTLTNVASGLTTSMDGRDQTCKPVMDAVVANTNFGREEFQNLQACSQRIAGAVDALGLDSVKTTAGQLVNPPNNTDTTQVLKDNSALDPTYFGWNKGDNYNDVLIRVNSFLSQLDDRLYSNPSGLLGVSFPFRQKARLNHEFVEAFGRTATNTTSTSTSTGNGQPEGVGNVALRSPRDLDKSVERIDVAVQKHNTTMENAGLTEPFSALLETYLIPYSTAGSNKVPSALSSLNQNTQTFGSGFLSFESSHFQLRRYQLGALSVGGRLGLAPVETLVTVSGTDTNPKAYLQNAFNWSLNVRGSVRLGTRSLLAIMGTFGQNVLLTTSSVVTPPASDGSTTTGAAGSAQTPASTTAPYGNYTQSGAIFYELGPELRIYPYHLQRVIDEKKFLLPSFSFTSGVRIDHRYSELNETEWGNFLKPTQRWFVRTFVTLTNVFERNPSQKSPSGLFNVGLGFEYDTVWGHAPIGRMIVPASSRIYINASIDLVKAFSKQAGQ